MSQRHLEKVEELQMVLMKNPRSPAFASLAEAYRKMGLLEEALEVTTKGIRHNPDYVSGLVAHAKVLHEMKDFSQAIQYLIKAHQLKPENILAMRLLGHCLVKTRKHREALRIFKKLLIQDPRDEKVQLFIKKWEFLDNVIPSTSKTQFDFEEYQDWIQDLPSSESAAHIVDSFLNFEDHENALEIANMALRYWPTSKALQHRRKILINAQQQKGAESSDKDNLALIHLAKKRAFYQQWLRRIETLKRIDP